MFERQRKTLWGLRSEHLMAAQALDSEVLRMVESLREKRALIADHHRIAGDLESAAVALDLGVPQ